MKNTYPPTLKSYSLDSALGTMLAVADEKALYLLEFSDKDGLEDQIRTLSTKTKSSILPGITDPIISIKRELELYFAGHLKEFKTAVHLIGSSFQKISWGMLMNIPYGQVRSYSYQAIAIGRPSAHRAVGNANSTNQIAIVVPCHRIINHNGKIGGYAGGIERKKWLLNHEKTIMNEHAVNNFL